METNSEKSQVLKDKFVSEGEALAQMLRAVADRIDERVASVSPSLWDMKDDHLAAAVDIVNDLNNLQGNMNTGAVITAARNADMDARGIRTF